MNKPSLRRKWTAAVMVGGLLTSAVASAPAWAERGTDEIGDDIDAAQTDLNETVEDYNALATEISDNEDMIEQAEADLEESEAELADLQERLANYFTEAYVDQGIGDTALLLDSGSPDAFVERVDRLNSANIYDFELLDDLNAASEEYTTQLDLLADLQADLEADQADLEEKKNDIEVLMEDLEAEWTTAAGEEVPGFDVSQLPGMTEDEWAVVSYALNQLNDPYVWGTKGPDTFDCSGLMLAAYSQIGISLPHNAAAQYNQTANISRDELRPGDLVFYNSLSHVGMYIGNGLIVHAPNSTTVVKVVELDHGNVYYGATTILH